MATSDCFHEWAVESVIQPICKKKSLFFQKQNSLFESLNYSLNRFFSKTLIQAFSILRNEMPIMCKIVARLWATVASFGTSCQTSISFVEQKCLNLSVPIASWVVRRHTAQLRSRRPEFNSRLEVLSRSHRPLSTQSCQLSTVLSQ